MFWFLKLLASPRLCASSPLEGDNLLLVERLPNGECLELFAKSGYRHYVNVFLFRCSFFVFFRVCCWTIACTVWSHNPCMLSVLILTRIVNSSVRRFRDHLVHSLFSCGQALIDDCSQAVPRECKLPCCSVIRLGALIHCYYCLNFAKFDFICFAVSE